MQTSTLGYRKSQKDCVSQKIAIASFESLAQTFSYAESFTRGPAVASAMYIRTCTQSLKQNLNQILLLATFYSRNYFVIYGSLLSPLHRLVGQCSVIII